MTTALQELLEKAMRQAKADAENPEVLARHQRREAAKRAERAADRTARLEAIPMRVGLAAELARIPRHLDAAACDCDARCVVPDGYRDRPAIDLVRRWMDARRAKSAKWRPILVMLGGTGCGKTSAAAWSCAWHAGSYTKTRALEMAHRAMFGAESQAWQSLMRANMLVIDDIAREPDAHAVAAFEDAIDERQSRPTIVTGNITKAELAQRYGGRVASRLAESGAVVWLDGQDMRARR